MIDLWRNNEHLAYDINVEARDEVWMRPKEKYTVIIAPAKQNQSANYQAITYVFNDEPQKTYHKFSGWIPFQGDILSAVVIG